MIKFSRQKKRLHDIVKTRYNTFLIYTWYFYLTMKGDVQSSVSCWFFRVNVKTWFLFLVLGHDTQQTFFVVFKYDYNLLVIELILAPWLSYTLYSKPHKTSISLQVKLQVNIYHYLFDWKFIGSYKMLRLVISFLTSNEILCSNYDFTNGSCDVKISLALINHWII